MSSFNLPRITRDTRESLDLKKEKCSLSPFRVVNIIYEILEEHLITNDPATLGYSFTQRYHPDPKQSTITLAVNYNWKADSAGKRPAVYLSRGDAITNTSLTLGQTMSSDVKTSTEDRIGLVSMPISISALANGLGFAEEFADYIKYPFMYYAKEISDEYCFKKFRLMRVSKPELYTTDAKDCFLIELSVLTEFYDIHSITGDYLPFKTMQTEVMLDDIQKSFQK